MTERTFRLSKSRYTLGSQCAKALYLEVHSPELKDAITPALQAIFDQGHEVGEYAQKHFPGGVLIDVPYEQLDIATRLTDEAISRGECIIYEATFFHDDVLVRIDILHRPKVGAPWHLVEVKSTASVKDQHLDDVAIQYYVARGAGLEIASASLMHINSDCVAPDFSNLFTSVELTSKAESRLASTRERVEQLRKMLKSPQEPAIDVGPHCTDPYECRFYEQCWSTKKLPSPNVFDIPNLGAKAWPLFEQGIVSLSDPRLPKMGGAAGRMIEVHKTQKRFIDAKAIRIALKGWNWPLGFLDFETIGPAIPKIDGTSPFQHVPFQFSSATWSAPDADVLYSDFLDLDSIDPRRSIAEAIVKLLPNTGSIVAYSNSFESKCLKLLAEEFHDLSSKLLDIESRLVDPLPIIRASVYDEKFLGSFSIKDVAPALCGDHLRYDGMEVSDGKAAQAAYAEAMRADTSDGRREGLREAMLLYCHRDVEVMVQVAKWLFAQKDNI